MGGEKNKIVVAVEVAVKRVQVGPTESVMRGVSEKLQYLVKQKM